MSEFDLILHFLNASFIFHIIFRPRLEFQVWFESRLKILPIIQCFCNLSFISPAEM